MTKHRHHHVWKHYLKAWSIDGKLFCLQDGNIFNPNPVNVAVERDFYKLRRLMPIDIAIIKWVIDQSPAVARQTNQNFLVMFSGWPELENSLAGLIETDPELKALIGDRVLNSEEDYHSRIEDNFIPLLDALRNRDLSFYDDVKKSGQFFYFLCLQWLRTKGIAERLFNAPGWPAGYDPTRSWGVLRHIFASNVGGSLFQDRKRRQPFLIENKTGCPFVTSDQPVVNLLGNSKTYDPPSTLALYYPVTPWLAFFQDEEGGHLEYGKRPLSAEEVGLLNAKMRDASHSQVFGVSRESLEALIDR